MISIRTTAPTSRCFTYKVTLFSMDITCGVDEQEFGCPSELIETAAGR